MKVIAMGSGPNVKQINDWDTTDCVIVGVNNTWRITDKWDHMIHAGDYPRNLRTQLKAKKQPHQWIHSREGNMGFKASYCGMAPDSQKQWEKARIYLGLPIYFGCMYWILYHLKPTHIGCIGFDMNYTPDENGNTAAYGIGHDMQTRGVPDPLWQFRNVPEYKIMHNPMHTLMCRLDTLSGLTQIYNLSDDPNTVLPWDQITIDKFKLL